MIHYNLQRQDDVVQLYSTGHAFVAAAQRLCESLLDDDDDADKALSEPSEDTRVILHLAYLGVELYLKAGLAESGMAYLKTHDLRALRQKYIDKAIALPLELPHFLRKLLGDVDPELPALTPVPMSRHFERYRYACDHAGRPFPPLPAVDLPALLEELVRLQGSAMVWLYPVLRGWHKPKT